MRDRALLLIVSVAVLLCSLAVGFVSYALGLGIMGFLVVVHAAWVFGAVLWYSANAWPNWHRRKVLRSWITVTYVTLFAVHWLIIASTFHRLRFEWGMWVWGAASVAEIFVIAFVLTVAVARAQSIVERTDG